MGGLGGNGAGITIGTTISIREATMGNPGGKGGQGGSGGQERCNCNHNICINGGRTGGQGGTGGPPATLHGGYLIIESNRFNNNYTIRAVGGTPPTRIENGMMIPIGGGDGIRGEGIANRGDLDHHRACSFLDNNTNKNDGRICAAAGYAGGVDQTEFNHRTPHEDRADGDPGERGENDQGGSGGRAFSAITDKQKLCAAGGGGGGKGSGGGGGGGGAGGIIIIVSPTINNNGMINVSGGAGGIGGNGGYSRIGGYGGNGIIHRTDTKKNLDGPIAYSGGGGGAGGAGGNGGKGADGQIIFIHAVGKLTKGNTSNVTPKEVVVSTVNTVITPSDPLPKSTSVWYNFNNQLFMDYSILYPNDNASDTYFGISKVQYNVNQVCNGITKTNLHNDDLDAQIYKNDNNNKQRLYLYPNTGFKSLWVNGTFKIESNEFLTKFYLCDGIHTLLIKVMDAHNNLTTFQKSIFIDQYAPCDNTNDTCTIDFLDTNDTPLNLATNGPFKVKINAIEASGSGTNPSATKLYIIKQIDNSNSPFHWYNSTDTISSIINKSETNRTCNTLFQLPSGISLSPMAHPVKADSTIDITNNIFSISAWWPPTPPTTPSTIDGTYWFIACLEDYAGNKSTIWDTSIPSNYPGIRNKAGNLDPYTLSIFNPTNSNGGFNYTETSKIAKAYLPPLYKRFVIDSNAVDASDCIADPCQVKILNPQPIHFENERNLSIAYDPPLYSTSHSLRVGIALPDDISGIAGVYYKIGNTPPKEIDTNLNYFIPRDTASTTRCETLRNTQNRMNSTEHKPPNWVDFCFDIIPIESTNLYIWVQDNAGNISVNKTFAQRKLYVDSILPTQPTNLTNPNNILRENTVSLSFIPSKDNIQISYHKLCIWPTYTLFNINELQNIINGQCPSITATGNNPVSTKDILYYQEQLVRIPPFTLDFGKWSFAVVGFDSAGNSSPFSTMYNLIISDGKSRLDYIEYDPNYNTGVYPKSGTNGYYNFKVYYSDLENRAPNLSQLWIDLNNNNFYDSDEKFDMEEEVQEGINILEKYTSGISFQIPLYLKYPQKIYQDENITKGSYKFKFYFETNSLSSIDGLKNGDPTKYSIITLDPYDLNSFDGFMQIRNNVATYSNEIKPTILLKAPPHTNTNNIINVWIYSKQHILIKKLIHNQPYSSIDRYVRWNLTDDQQTNVPTGLYWVVYEHDGDTLSIGKIIVK